MPSHNAAPKKARIAVWLGDLEQKDILEAVKTRGYSRPNVFIRTDTHRLIRSFRLDGIGAADLARIRSDRSRNRTPKPSPAGAVPPWLML
jgi:hypothetical protein